MATPDEVISVAELRQELRLAGDHHDALLAGHRASALALVSELSSRPILDVDQTYPVRLPALGSELPLRLLDVVIRAVSRIEYWSAGRTGREASDRQWAPADLGRLELIPGLGPGPVSWEIWPPAGGWPEVGYDRNVRVIGPAGMTVGAAANARDARFLPVVRAAVILLVRGFYDGDAVMGAKRAAGDLISPFLPVA